MVNGSVGEINAPKYNVSKNVKLNTEFNEFLFLTRNRIVSLQPVA